MHAVPLSQTSDCLAGISMVEIASKQDWLDAAAKYGVRKASIAPGLGVNFDSDTTAVAISWSGLLAIAEGIAFGDQLLFADTIVLPHVRWQQAFIETVAPTPPFVHLFGPEYGVIDPPDAELLSTLLIQYLDRWCLHADPAH